mmetsp:Transcript_58622/g.138086  ORF Transcript_58622/g.138086 Transcript_58622/m.138086 type:complete len:327 (+) Transcript_58622:2147-3127(+)
MQHPPHRLRLCQRHADPEPSAVLWPQPPAPQQPQHALGREPFPRTSTLLPELREQCADLLVTRHRVGHRLDQVLELLVPDVLRILTERRQQQVRFVHCHRLCGVELAASQLLLVGEQPQSLLGRIRGPLEDADHVLDAPKTVPRRVEEVLGQQQRLRERQRMLVAETEVAEGIERVAFVVGRVDGQHGHGPRGWRFRLARVLPLFELLDLHLLLLACRHLFLLLLLLLALLLSVEPVDRLADQSECADLAQNRVSDSMLLFAQDKRIVIVQHPAQLCFERDGIRHSSLEREVDFLVEHLETLHQRELRRIFRPRSWLHDRSFSRSF